MTRPVFPSTPHELDDYPAFVVALARIRPAIDFFAASTDYQIITLAAAGAAHADASEALSKLYKEGWAAPLQHRQDRQLAVNRHAEDVLRAGLYEQASMVYDILIDTYVEALDKTAPDLATAYHEGFVTAVFDNLRKIHEGCKVQDYPFSKWIVATVNDLNGRVIELLREHAPA